MTTKIIFNLFFLTEVTSRISFWGGQHSGGFGDFRIPPKGEGSGGPPPGNFMDCI